MSFVDLSHAIEDGMEPYPGLPKPVIAPLLTHEQSRARYENKAQFYLGRVDMPCNAGTYLDSPFHRYPEAADLSQLPLASVAGLPGIVLDGMAAEGRAVGIDAEETQLSGRAVLVRTGWDERWGTARYWEPGPYLSTQGARVAAALSRRAGGRRFLERGQHRGPGPPGTHALAGRRHPHRRKPGEPVGLAAACFPLFRGAAGHPAGRVIPGSRLRGS